MDTTELILKLGWIGWSGDLEKDVDSLVDWLYKEYGIDIEEKKPGSFSLSFQGRVLCYYYGVSGKEGVIK